MRTQFVEEARCSTAMGWMVDICRLYLEHSSELCDTHHKKHIYMYQKKGCLSLTIFILTSSSSSSFFLSPPTFYINGLFASRRATLSTLAVATT